MKIAKRILAIVLVLSLVLVFAACSSKKDKLVGTWTVDGESGLSFVFKADGGFEQRDGDEVDAGTFKVDGDNLILTAHSTSITFNISKLEEKTLVLTIDGDTITLTKQ